MLSRITPIVGYVPSGHFFSTVGGPLMAAAKRARKSSMAQSERLLLDQRRSPCFESSALSGIRV